MGIAVTAGVVGRLHGLGVFDELHCIVKCLYIVVRQRTLCGEFDKVGYLKELAHVSPWQTCGFVAFKCMENLCRCHLHGVDAEAFVKIHTEYVGETCIKFFFPSLLAQVLCTQSVEGADSAVIGRFFGLAQLDADFAFFA